MNDLPLGPAPLSDDLYAIGVQAHNALDEGRWADAAALYAWVLRLARRDGDPDAEAAALHQLGVVASRWGRPAEARELYEQSLRLKRDQGNRGGQSATLHELGRLALAGGDLPAA